MKKHLKIQYLALFCALLSTPGYSQFRRIIENLNKRNLGLVEAEIEKRKSVNQNKSVEAQSDIILSTVFEHETGKPVNLFSQFSQESSYNRASLGLSKLFAWGGTLSFNHIYENQDISKWPSANILQIGGTDAYFLSNSLVYSQDLGKNLFGVRYRSQLEQAEIGAEIANTNFDYMEETTLFQTFQSYLNTKLDKKLLRISKDFLDRAKKRKKLIAKRFKDGVAIQADYYQSENAYARAQEIYRDSEVKFEKSFQSLKEIASYDVSSESVLDFKSSQYFTVINQGKNLIGNKELLLLDQRLRLAKQVLREYETRDNFDITLDFAISRTGLKNNYDDSLSDSFSEDEFENKSIGLNITVPLGTAPESYEKINRSLDVKKSEHERSITLKNIMRNDLVLRSELKKIEENLASSKKRLNLDRKILKEQNRRYNRGQVDFDQVLNAEESLLDTERSYYQYFSRVLILRLGINHLYGELRNSLELYSE